MNRRLPPPFSEGASGSCHNHSGGTLRFVKTPDENDQPDDRRHASRIAPSAPTRCATTRSSWRPPARRSPRPTAPPRSRTSPAAPASASARCTATSPPAPTSCRPSTSTRSRRCHAARASSPSLEPWDALTAWLQSFVGYVATKQALAEELFAVSDAERQAVFASCRAMLYGAGEPLLQPRAGRGHRPPGRDDRGGRPPRRRHREDPGRRPGRCRSASSPSPSTACATGPSRVAAPASTHGARRPLITAWRCPRPLEIPRGIPAGLRPCQAAPATT